jgi:transcriptional regulator with XRE-family HTH domain
MNVITANVKKAMKKANLTQVELAKRLNISQGELSRRLSGRQKPTDDFLGDLSKALKISAEELLKPAVSFHAINQDISKMMKGEVEDMRKTLDVARNTAEEEVSNRELLFEIRNRLEVLEQLMHKIAAKLTH